MLTDEQSNAVNSKSNLFLIAGPGSGKTHTLIQRIIASLYEIESHRKLVVAITYTRAAADEIKQRILDEGLSTQQLWVGTIHSFCLDWILRPYQDRLPEIPVYFRTATEFEAKIIFKSHFPNLRFSDYDFKFEVKGIFDQRGKNYTSEQLETLNQYQKFLFDKNLITFEQIIKFSYQLLNDYPDISYALSLIFKEVLIDEYQDTRLIQLQILSFISRLKNTKFFIVGDANQAIYESMNGKLLSIPEIERLFGIEFEVMNLSKNFRSSQRIVNFCSNFAVEKKSYEAIGADRNFNSTIRWNCNTSKEDLCKSIGRIIHECLNELSIKQQDIAIVAPRWVHLEEVTKRLTLMFPEFSFDGPEASPFKGLKDNFWYSILYLSITVPSPENFTKRFIHATKIIQTLKKYLSHFDHCQSDVLKMSQFFKESNLTDCIEYAKDIFKKFSNLFELSKFVPKESELHTAYNDFIHTFRNNLGKDIYNLAPDSLGTYFAEKTGIKVSTIHQVKGNEFDVVISFGLLEGYIPHWSTSDEMKYETANKLIYVLASRAKKNLYLFSEQGRYQSHSKTAYIPTGVLQNIFKSTIENS